MVSEVSVRATDPEKVPKLLEQMGITLVALPLSAAVPAAKAFALYLDRLKVEGKKTGSKVPLPDFLIGAHAQAEGLKLATRDPKRVGTYFPKVLLVTPSDLFYATGLGGGGFWALATRSKIYVLAGELMYEQLKSQAAPW